MQGDWRRDCVVDLIRETRNGERAYLACIASFQPCKRVYRMVRLSFWRRLLRALGEGWGFGW